MEVEDDQFGPGQRGGFGGQRSARSRQAGCGDDGYSSALRGDLERRRRRLRRNLDAVRDKPTAYSPPTRRAAGVHFEAPNDRYGTAGALPNGGWQCRGIVRDGFSLGEPGVEAWATPFPES